MNRQINTVSDIVEVLRDNPEALTELRSVMFPGGSGVTEDKIDEILQLVRRQEAAGVRRDEAEARREEAEARREEAEARREEAEIRRDAAITRMGDAIAALVESVEGLRGDVGDIRGNVEVLRGDVGGVHGNIEVLRGDVEGVHGNIEVLRGDMVGLGTDLGHLKGLGVESVLQGRVMQTIGSRMNIDEPVVLVSMQLPNRVDVGFKALVEEAAGGDSPVISRGDQTRILETDLIIQGVKDDAHVEAYLAVEASYTIQVNDITRVMDTRSALRKLFSEAEVIGAVFGVVISDDDKRLARRSGIRVYETQLPT